MPEPVQVTASVPGTCGELIQGWSDEWDEAVLVSCPITRYSRVSLRLTNNGAIRTPPGSGSYAKLKQAVRLFLAQNGHAQLGAQVQINSQLLPGRGMASSTADMVGAMAALGRALNQPGSPELLARLACQVEPSDSIMFAGLAAMAYRGSSRVEKLGQPPPLPLLMLDTGTAVDTLSYNARLNLSAVRQLAPTTTEALTLLQEGLMQRRPEAIGAAATLSARSYQVINYNPLVSQAEQWADQTGALGVVRAHSGSVVGLLYREQTPLADIAAWLVRHFAGSITLTQLTGGGWRLEKNPIVSAHRCQPVVQAADITSEINYSL